MKDISQKPVYEIMWKVECELNQSLQSQLKQKDEELDKLYNIIQAKNIEESFIKSELIGITEQLKEKNEALRGARDFILTFKEFVHYHDNKTLENHVGLIDDLTEWLEKNKGN